MPITTWQVIDTLPLQTSGNFPTYKDANLGQLSSRNYKGAGRSLVDEPIGINDNFQTRVRVKLCLRTHQEHCGDPMDAECKYFLLKSLNDN